jgi:5'-nucleotidase
MLMMAAVAVVAAGCAVQGEAEPPFHVMVVNDDGVDAPGIAALAAVLAQDPTYRLTVVAPAEQQSGKGHALVFRDEIRVAPHPAISGFPTWSVGATPATTARIGLSALLADDPPDLVLSGINRGENVGRIAWYSGTVGGAREALLAGFPAVAFSLALNWKDPQPDYDAAARWAKPVVDAVRQHGLPEGIFLNVNFPTDPTVARGYRLCRMGLMPDEINRYELVSEDDDGVRSYKSHWAPPAEPTEDTDGGAIANGWVAVVPLGLDQTAYAALPSLAFVHRLDALMTTDSQP